MSDKSLTSRDYGALADILDLARAGNPEDPRELTFQLLDRLEVLLGSDGPSFQVVDAVHHSRSHVQMVEGGEHFEATAEELAAHEGTSGMDVFWQFWWTSPCSVPERTGRPATISLRSFLSQREWVAHPVHTSYLPFADEIVLAYPTGPGQSVRILLPRDDGGSAFGHRELTLVALLEPHLKQLLLRTASVPESPFVLTARQVEILRLVERGLSNREVGRELGIREATVRKHLEHTYVRLGVLSRTGAVTAAFGPAAAG